MLPFGLFAGSHNIQEDTELDSTFAYTLCEKSNENSLQGSQYNRSMQMQSECQQPDQRYGVSLSGDYLYFVPYFSRMPYAQQDDTAFDTVPDSSGVRTGSATIKEIDVAGDSGYRITGSYQSDW